MLNDGESRRYGAQMKGALGRQPRMGYSAFLVEKGWRVWVG
jgi:hypothetical protein